MTGFSFYNIKRTPKDRGGGKVGAVVKRNRGKKMGGVDGKSNLLDFYPGGGLRFWRVPVFLACSCDDTRHALQRLQV